MEEKEIYEPSRYLDDGIEAFVARQEVSLFAHVAGHTQPSSTNIVIRIRRNKHACFELSTMLLVYVAIT